MQFGRMNIGLEIPIYTCPEHHCYNSGIANWITTKRSHTACIHLEGGVDLLKPNGSVFMGVTVGSGPQSKVGAVTPAGDGPLVGSFFNFGEGPCREPPIMRRLGPRSCDGDSSNEAGFQGCGDSGNESNPNPRPGVEPSSLMPGDFCGVAKARGAAGALAAFVLRRGCCRADSSARFNRWADTSPFKAFAAFTTTDGAVLYGRLGSGRR